MARAQDDVTQAQPARALDAASLRAATLDLYGRPPFESERLRWTGVARHEFVDQALGSPECWRHWLEEQLFYFLLIDNFRPESSRVEALPELLAQGKLDVRDAIHRIALSPSFDQRNPGADTFVTVVMEQLNGLRVQKNPRELEVGKAIYDGRAGTFLGRTGSSQSDILSIAVADRSFAETLIEREYRRILRAEPERKALADWVRRLQRDAFEFRGIVREWLLAPAWDARVASKREAPNRLWVRALYVDLLGRLPSDEEARRLRSALDGLSDAAPLRSVFARVLIDSGQVALPERDAIPEPSGWIAERFRSLLGREPSARELESFVSTFRDAECRPQTVLYAIVTHPEYQSY
ncbi:MAG: hypothetical protein IT454_01730 [Planctomycetes bacterium]|nr:hypothetical protein [Planctomycetota bacterium]